MGFCYIWLYRRKKGAKDIFKKASSSNWLLLVQLLEDVMARRPASFDALCRRSTRFRRFVADVVVVDDVVVVGGGSKQVGVLSLFAFIVEKTWQKMPGTFRKKLYFPAAIAPWFCLCLQSCGRVFESQAHHLHFFQFLLLKL